MVIMLRYNIMSETSSALGRKTANRGSLVDIKEMSTPLCPLTKEAITCCMNYASCQTIAKRKQSESETGRVHVLMQYAASG